MDSIEALSAAYLTSHNMFCHDEDLEQLWWYVKQVQEVLYICVCACVSDYMEQTRTLSIASYIHYVTPSFLVPSIMIMTDESKNVNWYFSFPKILSFLHLK